MLHTARAISTVAAMSLVACMGLTASAADEPIRIYVDASRSGGSARAGIAIERGIRTALDEVGNKLGGRKVELVLKDHRGSSPRSKRHLDQFLADDRALAVFSGMHSPPLLAHLDFINENGILVLDPWAAAGPITRHPSARNSVFRLSVDDRKAGVAIARHAIDVDGFRKPALLLEQTGWGDSNLRSMTRALATRGVQPVGTWRFPWGLSEVNAGELVEEIRHAGADVIFLVCNEEEGEVLLDAVARFGAGRDLPIRSHWGITGGLLTKRLSPASLAKLDLRFLQTRFSFMSPDLDAHAMGVLKRATDLFDDVDGPADVDAPAGFIHAYDLTRLLIAAVTQTELTGDLVKDRERVRLRLERLDGKVKGLVKTYERPFRPFTEGHPDAHEALGLADLRMARYGENGEIFLLDDTLSTKRSTPASGVPSE